MSRLRIVAGADGGAPACTIADAARAAMEKVIAQGATVVLIFYETPAVLDYEAVPDSEIVAQGVARMMHELFNAPKLDDTP